MCEKKARGWRAGLAGLDFLRHVVELEKKYGRPRQIVGNALQTNGILLNEAWARFLSKYQFLVGISLDGPAVARLLSHDQESARHLRHGLPADWIAQEA